MKQLLILGFVLLFAVSAFASDGTLVLSSDKEAHSLGDTITIYADVKNNSDYTVEARIYSILTNEKETYPTAFVPFDLELAPNASEKILIYEIPVDESIDSDNYTISASLLFNETEITSDSLEFQVTDTPQDLSFLLKTCEDALCETESKVFTQGQTVYIDFESDTNELNVTATLTLPDGKVKTVSLPAPLTTLPLGTYEINARASKEGFREAIVKNYFGVIESEPIVNNLFALPNNEANETTTPPTNADPTGEEPPAPGTERPVEETTPFQLYPLLAFVIIAIGALIYTNKIIPTSRNKKILLIAVLIVAAAILIYPLIFPTTSYNIRVGDEFANKTITLTPDAHTEKITMDNADSVILFLAVPPALAEKAAELRFQVQGQKVYYSHFPLIRVDPNNNKINATAIFQPGNADKTTIAFFVKKSFINALNEEDLQTVLNKMTETLELNLNIQEIKELENNLAFETIKIE
jgi:hypothetical protein